MERVSRLISNQFRRLETLLHKGIIAQHLGSCQLLMRSLQRDLEKTDDPNVHYFSKHRQDCLNTTILCLVLLSLLVLPVYVLFRLLKTHPDEKAYTESIGVMIIFMLLFSGVLSFFTKAKRHEIFAAAAG